jgi:hypothetical protein
MYKNISIFIDYLLIVEGAFRGTRNWGRRALFFPVEIDLLKKFLGGRGIFFPDHYPNLSQAVSAEGMDGLDHQASQEAGNALAFEITLDHLSLDGTPDFGDFLEFGVLVGLCFLFVVHGHRILSLFALPVKC